MFSASLGEFIQASASHGDGKQLAGLVDMKANILAGRQHHEFIRAPNIAPDNSTVANPDTAAARKIKSEFNVPRLRTPGANKYSPNCNDAVEAVCNRP